MVGAMTTHPTSNVGSSVASTVHRCHSLRSAGPWSVVCGLIYLLVPPRYLVHITRQASKDKKESTQHLERELIKARHELQSAIEVRGFECRRHVLNIPHAPHACLQIAP